MNFKNLKLNSIAIIKHMVSAIIVYFLYQGQDLGSWVTGTFGIIRIFLGIYLSANIGFSIGFIISRATKPDVIFYKDSIDLLTTKFYYFIGMAIFGSIMGGIFAGLIVGGIVSKSMIAFIIAIIVEALIVLNDLTFEKTK